MTRSDGSPLLHCLVGLWENRAPSTRGKGLLWESIRVDGNRTEVTSHQPEACLLLPGHRSRDKPLTVVALPTLLYSYQHPGKLGVSVLEYSEIFLGSQEKLEQGCMCSVLF